MRKAIAALGATAALLFAGAGVANASAIEGAAPAPTTVVAQPEVHETESDNSGMWGLAGLLGLLGLAGLLKRRNDRPVTSTAGSPGTPGYGTAPRG